MGLYSESFVTPNTGLAKFMPKNLSDFRSTSCWSPLSYGIVYYFFAISVGVYAVDLFTAANLLFFGRWSSQVKPAIPFEISRWVFAGCIILSWVFLAYRWWRAIRAMKTGVITASYLDPLAVRVESMRIGKKGQGWHRFLVFAALTKGRKGSEYVALFTYFSFEGESKFPQSRPTLIKLQLGCEFALQRVLDKSSTH